MSDDERLAPVPFNPGRRLHIGRKPGRGAMNVNCEPLTRFINAHVPPDQALIAITATQDTHEFIQLIMFAGEKAFSANAETVRVLERQLVAREAAHEEVVRKLQAELALRETIHTEVVRSLRAELAAKDAAIAAAVESAIKAGDDRLSAVRAEHAVALEAAIRSGDERLAAAISAGDERLTVLVAKHEVAASAAERQITGMRRSLDRTVFVHGSTILPQIEAANPARYGRKHENILREYLVDMFSPAVVEDVARGLGHRMDYDVKFSNGITARGECKGHKPTRRRPNLPGKDINKYIDDALRHLASCDAKYSISFLYTAYIGVGGVPNVSDSQLPSVRHIRGSEDRKAILVIAPGARLDAGKFKKRIEELVAIVTDIVKKIESKDPELDNIILYERPRRNRSSSASSRPSASASARSMQPSAVEEETSESDSISLDDEVLGQVDTQSIPVVGGVLGTAMKMASSLDPVAALAVSQAYSASQAVEVEREKTRREREAAERQARQKLEAEARRIADAARTTEEQLTRTKAEEALNAKAAYNDVFKPDAHTKAQVEIRAEILKNYKLVLGKSVDKTEIIKLIMTSRQCTKQVAARHLQAIFTDKAYDPHHDNIIGVTNV